jgi:hypothetical protein
MTHRKTIRKPDPGRLGESRRFTLTRENFAPTHVQIAALAGQYLDSLPAWINSLTTLDPFGELGSTVRQRATSVLMISKPGWKHQVRSFVRVPVDAPAAVPAGFDELKARVEAYLNQLPVDTYRVLLWQVLKAVDPDNALGSKRFLAAGAVHFHFDKWTQIGRRFVRTVEPVQVEAVEPVAPVALLSDGTVLSHS